MVLNYLGPNDQQGIRIFYNGEEVASDMSKNPPSHSPGDGRIVVGRFLTDRDQDQDYASVQVDEMLFFNQALSTTDITILNNSVSFL